jgi:cation diffusion facilitator CzcD-associated flavoprotein CzcO
MAHAPTRIAVIGAGPVGLEAALHGASLGHDVRCFERGRVGENVRRWGHVVLFSPFHMNRSPLGAAELGRAGASLPDGESYLTGAEYVKRYLAPLARTPLLAGRVHEGCRIAHIGREGLTKRDPIGAARAARPFRLLVERARREEALAADVVIDCSGTYAHPNWLGSGGIPAVGERRLAERIRYQLEPLAGEAVERYTGRSVLLAGDGHSAATALADLVRLAGTSVVWLSRRDRAEPYTVLADDPLPERARLGRLGNELAAGSSASVEHRRATVVERVEDGPGPLRVTLRSAAGSETRSFDRILAHTGYSPDNSLYRELQVHECYASLGPMNLSAALAGAGGATDCLAQLAHGPETLRNPEPGFFVLGAKSYGKNPQFLIRLGIEQIREVFTLVGGG